jgi:two-component sensor histidine kinase
MTEKKFPTSNQEESGASRLNRISSTKEANERSEIDRLYDSETIDLDHLFTSGLSVSGSFDIRGEIWASTFGKVLQALPIPALLIDQTLKVTVANQAWGRISSEYQKIEGEPFSGLLPDPAAAQRANSLVEDVFLTRKARMWIAKLKIQQRPMWGRLTFRSIRVMKERFVLLLVEDLTREVSRLEQNRRLQEELQKQAGQLAAEVHQKELLLRELNHRVKNNLQLLASVVALQTQYVKEPATLGVLTEIADRIHSIALIHENLYRSRNLSALSARKSLGTLADHLLATYNGLGRAITFHQDIEDVSLGIDTVIPLGLIFTELVSNCLKHAFPQGVTGEIKVSLRTVGEKEFQLVVADNGVGIPDDVDTRNPRSLGLDLVDSFVGQLRGAMEIVRREGTEVQVRFFEASPKKRS